MRGFRNAMLALGVVAMIASQANADYSFPVNAGGNVAAGTGLNLAYNDAGNSAGVTSGLYGSFEFTADWVAGAGNPWSSEAEVTLTTAAGSVNIDPPSAGGLNSNAATTLTFSGLLPGPYDPDVDGSLDLFLEQSFGGSDADWSNGNLTLFDYVDPTPTPLATLDYDPNGPAVKYQGILAAPGGLDWISLTIADDGTPVLITTTKTFAIPFEDRVDDTEIGIYDSLGNLVANNDDISFPSNPYSQLALTLDAGKYYIAVGEYNVAFGATQWGAAPSSPVGEDGGGYWLNVIPEPGTALLLGLGVVGLIRRRR